MLSRVRKFDRVRKLKKKIFKKVNCSAFIQVLVIFTILVEKNVSFLFIYAEVKVLLFPKVLSWRERAFNVYSFCLVVKLILSFNTANIKKLRVISVISFYGHHKDKLLNIISNLYKKYNSLFLCKRSKCQSIYIFYAFWNLLLKNFEIFISMQLSKRHGTHADINFVLIIVFWYKLIYSLNLYLFHFIFFKNSQNLILISIFWILGPDTYVCNFKVQYRNLFKSI